MRLLPRISLLAAALYTFVALALLGSGVGFWFYTDRPQFCRSCHVMKPYYASWQDSRHYPKATCLNCHTKPGVRSALALKLRYGAEILSLRKHRYPYRLARAEIYDESCLRPGCHQNQPMDRKVPIHSNRQIPHVSLGKAFFNHKNHLDHPKRGLNLRCVTCHYQIVQGKHLTVEWQVCILCHFKGGESDPMAGCGVCHTAPQGKITFQGMTFSHAEYTKRGVACDRCHVRLTQGSGQARQVRCQQCHSLEFSRQRFSADIEFMHRKHVREHAVNCLSCHEPIEHKSEQLTQAIVLDCTTCHNSRHNVQQAMYMGVNGKGLADEPDPMFASRVNCQGCHRSSRSPAGHLLKATLAECVHCHGKGYDRLARRWQLTIQQASRELSPLLQQVERELQNSPRDRKYRSARALFLSARDNYQMVQNDRSWGIHNVRYSYRLLQKSDELLNTSLHTLRPDQPVRRRVNGFSIEPDCERCHIGIPQSTRPSRFAGFDHRPHLQTGAPCTLCHASGKANHGKLTIGDRDCATCHRQVHGNG